MRASSAIIRCAPRRRTSRSTAPRFLKTCSKPPCSVMRRAPSRAHSGRTPANSNRRREAPCCSTRSRKWILDCRPRYCAFCRSAKSSGSGSSRTISLDVRVIATSNRDLPEEVRAGRFRADLYYRLNVMSLRLPPLRERFGDILPLARRAIQTCARGGAGRLEPVRAPPNANCWRHDWPGNARELTNIVQRAAWLASGGIIDAEDLDTGAPEQADQPQPAVAHTAPPPPTQEAGLDHDLKERERELIMATLRVTGGSRKLTAERLGISPRTLASQAAADQSRRHQRAAAPATTCGGVEHDQHADSTSIGGDALACRRAPQASPRRPLPGHSPRNSPT